MAVPTEVLNDDIKDLRGDVREVRIKVESVKDEAQRIALYQAELKGEFRFIKLFLGLLLTGLIGAGVEFFRLDAHVVSIESKFDKLETRLDKIEAKVDARFEKLEERMDGMETQMKGIEAQLAGLRSLVSRLVEPGKTPANP